MKTLPWNARTYIFSLAALASGAVLFSFITVDKELSTLLAILIVAIGIALMDAVPITAFSPDIEITLSNSVKFATILLYPLNIVILAVFLGTIIGELVSNRVWIKKIFNISQMTATWFAVTWVYQNTSQPNVAYFSSLQNIFALLLAGTTNFLVNILLVSRVISLSAKLPWGYVLRKSNTMIPYEFTTVLLGTSIAILWQYNPLSMTLVGFPLFIVRKSLQTNIQLQTQTLQALRALVRVVDERDHHTFDHSERVSENARLIAEALDLPQDDIEVIAPAALLHDLGKVGMADDILFGAKRLNSDERRHAELHAEVGAQLLEKFPLFEKGAHLVKHHHERYDGKGYPDGLKGEEIPLGARIISVADSYQAMTEVRPYRPSLELEEAIQQLEAERGAQFDRVIVDTFVRILRSKAQPANTQTQ